MYWLTLTKDDGRAGPLLPLKSLSYTVILFCNTLTISNTQTASKYIQIKLRTVQIQYLQCEAESPPFRMYVLVFAWTVLQKHGLGNEYSSLFRPLGFFRGLWLVGQVTQIYRDLRVLQNADWSSHLPLGSCDVHVVTVTGTRIKNLVTKRINIGRN